MGLGLAMGQQVVQVDSQKAQQVQAKIEKMEQHMDSNAEKLSEFEQFVNANPGRIFSWTDDTVENAYGDMVLNQRSKETLPLMNIGTQDEPNLYYVLPPEWSVAEQVLIDKEQPPLENGMPYIAVPGSNVGEIPSAEEIQAVLSKSAQPNDNTAIHFIDDYREDFVPVPSALAQFGNFHLPIEAIPDDMPMVRTGLNKREQYIAYYFTTALGKEDAQKFVDHFEEDIEWPEGAQTTLKMYQK